MVVDRVNLIKTIARARERGRGSCCILKHLTLPATKRFRPPATSSSLESAGKSSLQKEAAPQRADQARQDIISREETDTASFGTEANERESKPERILPKVVWVSATFAAVVYECA